MTESLSSDQRALRNRLEDMPENVRPHIRVGFENLTHLDGEKRIKLFRHIMSEFSSRASYDIDRVAEIAGCERRSCGDIISATAMTISSIIDLDVEKQDFLKFLPSDVYSEDQIVVIDELLEIVFSSRSQIKEEAEKSRVANSVLPSFAHADMAIDLRFKFNSKDEVEARVPVLIAYLATDSRGDDLWVQFGEKELDGFISELQRMRRRMESVSENV